HNEFPQYDGTTIHAYRLPSKKADAQNANIDYTIIKTLLDNVPAAWDKVVDYDGDGFIDNVTIILKGSGENNGMLPSLYPHQSTYPGNERWGDKMVSNYNMLNTDRLLESILADESGVICHEFLHSLGYPDLYTSSGTSHPVYNWDIMGLASKYLSYPLAYLRMHFSGWLSLDTITTSQTLTLDAPETEGGNVAYILKSPLNPYEIFVVEMRKKTSPYDENTIDSRIGGSGVIVYRVDTTVDGLSNYSGKTGVYIFRPQPNQNGYDANEILCLQNAYLSFESGSTSIGSADLSKTLVDGALTFSDGTNSGIVIENVSSSSGNQMTLDVKIPDAAEFDTWNDTKLPEAENVAIASIENEPYAAAVSGGNLQLYRYEAGGWQKYGTTFTDTEGFADIKLLELEGVPFVAYTSGYGNLLMKKYDASLSTWKDCGAVGNVSSFDVSTYKDGAYISYVVDNKNASLAKLEGGTSFTQMGSYFSGTGFCGDAQVLVANGEVYVSVREVLGNKIVVKKYDAQQNNFQEIQSPANAKGYDMISYNDEIYYASGDVNELVVKKFNGSGWEDYAKKSIDSFIPQLAVAQGNLYVLSSPSVEQSNERMRVFEVENGTLTQEGLDVDLKSTNYALIASENELFVSYVNRNQKAMVKQKNTANSLLSLTIEAPKKLSYLKGEEVSLDGLKVTANYQRGTRVLSPGEYTVVNFDTTQTGARQAVVSFGGITNTFTYNVFEEVEIKPIMIGEISINDVKEPAVNESQATSASTNTEGVQIDLVSWNPSTDTFLFEQDYTLELHLSTKGGYGFDSNVQILFNGSMAGVTLQRISDESIVVQKIFPKIPAPEITLDRTAITLYKDESTLLKVTDETNSEILWESSNPSVATVDENGTVRAVGVGNTVITVRNLYGKSASATVEVKEKETIIETVESSESQKPTEESTVEIV
ncbi:MAG: Ig-like domain-containing protein, partial [Lachnospiraceae bacterium]